MMEDLWNADDNTLHITAREQLEYGESSEGYWTNQRFMKQMEGVKLAETKYPMTEGYLHVWIFDHSSCHAAKVDNALDVSQVNVKPGGKQPAMRGTIWQGRLQQLMFNIGVPKGMKIILEERGINTRNVTADQKDWDRWMTSRMRSPILSIYWTREVTYAHFCLSSIHS